MKDTDWAYLAGFFDGEGCITRQIAKRRHLTFVYVRLSVSQSHRPTLERLQSIFPVGIVRDKYSTEYILSLKHPAIGATWAICDQEHVLWLLRGMLPYLDLKRDQARIGIKLCSDPDLSLEERLKWVRVLSKLKRRGFRYA